jgi:hypothetical protein
MRRWAMCLERSAFPHYMAMMLFDNMEPVWESVDTKARQTGMIELSVRWLDEWLEDDDFFHWIGRDA